MTMKNKIIQDNKDFMLYEAIRHINCDPPNSRKFSVGELVNFGSHPNAKIEAVYENNRVYKVRCWGTYSEYGRQVERDVFHYVNWTQLLPLSAFKDRSETVVNRDVHLNYSNMVVDSILSTYYNGIDMNPEYQRDFVWSAEDKVALIDSIFNNRSIGSYILCFNGYGKEVIYEVLDGKQRIQALVDFFEDKFRYKGKLYTEMSQTDRNWFENFEFPRAKVEKPTREQKIKIFIHVNTTGRHMEKEHLDKVKSMLKEDN